MALRFQVKNDFSQVRRLSKDLKRKIVPKATSSAINKTTQQMRTRVVREVAPAVGVIQKIIRARTRIERSKPKTLVATLIARVAGVSMIDIKPVSEGAGGVTAGKFHRQGAFISKDKTGKKRVFKRRGKSRLPIDKQTVSIEKEVDGAAKGLLDSFVPDKYKEIFNREMRFRLSKRRS